MIHPVLSVDTEVVLAEGFFVLTLLLQPEKVA